MSPSERLGGAHFTSHPVIEDFVVSVLSLLVLIVAVMSLLGTQDPRLAYAAKPIGTGGGRITIYGSLLDSAGLPIVGATITVRYKDGTKAATTTTAADGTFSMSFTDGPSPLPVEVRVGTAVANTTLDVQPSMKYGLKMTFVEGSTFVFVPLPGY